MDPVQLFLVLGNADQVDNAVDRLHGIIDGENFLVEGNFRF